MSSGPLIPIARPSVGHRIHCLSCSDGSGAARPSSAGGSAPAPGNYATGSPPPRKPRGRRPAVGGRTDRTRTVTGRTVNRVLVPTVARRMTGMTAPLTEPDVRAAVDRVLPGVLEDLRRLVAIPSVSFPEFDRRHVQQSAELTEQLLRDCGLQTQIVSAGEGQPGVIGRRPAPPGAPTVLLYAHHDVQPPGDPAVWQSEPFTVTERDGRLYGRGVADDKAGVMAHVAALRALGDQLGVGVVVFVEGEEEYGSQTLEALLPRPRDTLTADVIVIADSANWDVGVPALTTSLRGIVNLFVEVRTLESAVHSGMFGGAVPDALTVLSRLLATLHDEAGDVAVPGLVHRPAAPLEYP